MLVENVMTPKDKLVIVSQMNALKVALQRMKKHRVKAVIVDKASPGGAYGLVTFKNILQAIVSEDGDIELLNIYDVATTPAISVSKKMDIKYAARMMVNSGIKRLLVIDNNELEGILTMSDIVNVLLESIEE
ncbi:MAG: histidine kinase [Sulfurovum sp. FS08-3]|nr:MAG: histidine kinase [Sulfurovum sp. FS08-3]